MERGEASISRTLEAILSKTDDDEVPLTADITGAPAAGTGRGRGGQTLLGYAGAKLPGVTPAELDDAAGPSISVDTMFDDPEDDLVGKAMAPPVGPPGPSGPGEHLEVESEEKVGNLLDEVAEALNVQAAETRDRAIGRVPSPGANAPGARGSMKTPLVRTAEEFEFEDPDDGPTTLNAGDGKVDGKLGAASDEDDEESVVLGPGSRSEGRREPRSTGSHPGANLAGTNTRGPLPVPAVPMPGSAGASNGRTTRATPFAGLPAATLPTFPAPGSGRTRLPTPAPGTALGVPSPSTNTGRNVPPPGAPSSAREESAGAIPVMSMDPAAARRSSGRVSASLATLSSADSSGRNGAVEEAHPSALSSARLVLEQALLKKDLKFRAISFGAIVLGVFVGGLFIGHAVMKGSPDATAAAPASPAPAVTAAKPAEPATVAPGAPAAGTAPAKTAVIVPDVSKTPAAAPAAAAPAVAPNAAAPGAMAEATAAGTAQMQFDAQPARKRRSSHRAAPLPANDDLDVAPAPKRIAAVASAPVAKAPTAGKAGPKKKSTWHDPFAD